VPKNISLWALNFGDFRCVESDTCGLHEIRVFGQTMRLVDPEGWHVYQRVQQLVPATNRKKEGYLAQYGPHQNMCFGTGEV